MIINLKNPTDLSSLYFVYYGSTNLETEGSYGLSHLMEHLECKAFDDLQDELQECQIQWNAYTSNNYIVFYFQGLEEYLSKFRDKLFDRLGTFNITEEDLEKEKKIVLEEYNDFFSDQYSTFLSNMYRRHYSSYLPIGKREDVKNVSLKECQDYHKLQYLHPDLVISVSKDYVLDRDDLEFANRKSLMKTSWKYNEDIQLEPQMSLENKACVAYDIEIDKDDSVAVSIISKILSSGLNSPFVQEIREKNGLAYFVNSSVDRLGDKYIYRITTMTAPENLETIDNILDDIFNNPEKHLTQNRLNIIKQSNDIKVKMRKINRFANIEDMLDDNIDKFNSMLESINVEDLKEVYDKYFKIDKFKKITEDSLAEKELAS